MTSTSIYVISFAFLMINSCLSMVILSTTKNLHSSITTSSPRHIVRVRIRVQNSSIEILINKKQLDLIDIQLQQRHIPYRQIQDNKDGITITIGPFHKSVNFTAIMSLFNQSRFYTNFTKLMSIKSQTIDLNQKKTQSGRFPMTVKTHEYNIIHDQESSEFRHCLESCEIYEDNELTPDHDCIREKCLKEITGI